MCGARRWITTSRRNPPSRPVLRARILVQTRNGVSSIYEVSASRVSSSSSPGTSCHGDSLLSRAVPDLHTSHGHREVVQLPEGLWPYLPGERPRRVRAPQCIPRRGGTTLWKTTEGGVRHQRRSKGPTGCERQARGLGFLSPPACRSGGEGSPRDSRRLATVALLAALMFGPLR